MSVCDSNVTIHSFISLFQPEVKIYRVRHLTYIFVLVSLIMILLLIGYGDMAVANAVGSNAFDILICLGVPWLLQTLITNPGKPVQVYSGGGSVIIKWGGGASL